MDVPCIIAVCAIAAVAAGLFIAFVYGAFVERGVPRDPYAEELGKDGL
jgi:hypothetical protein